LYQFEFRFRGQEPFYLADLRIEQLPD